MSTKAEALPGIPELKQEDYTGVWSWITTVDHKRIGILYGVTAFAFFLIGGLEALIIRMQLARPEATVVGATTFNSMFTMHALTMVFLVIMPLGAAFFNYLIPLMIGARDVAFPRLNSLSYWVFLAGGLFMNSSFLFGAVPDVGWFAYANLTSKAYSPGLSVEFYYFSLQILGISSMMAGFNFIVTILNMRAPGMTLMRMPVFAWMTLVVQFLVVLAFPIITVGLVFLQFDRFFGTNFYVPAAGGDPLLWQHLFWLFGHPEVYILILPAMGIVSEVLPTFSHKPLFGAPFVIFSGIVIGFLGFGVWSHHMFTTGLGPVADSAFSATTMLIAVPTGVKIFNWIATLWGGRIRLTAAMLFAIGFIGLFIIGGLSGIMHASPPVDLQQQDTYFIVAHIHYVLFGGSIMGLFAGIYYWFPKMTGKLLDEKLGKLHFWLQFVAMNITFFPMHFTGADGMPRRIYTYFESDGWGLWNLVSSLGSFAIALAIVIFFVNFFRSLRSGKPAPADPWDGATLEWTIPSPPPVYNFARTPVVHSSRPLWDAKYAAEGGKSKPEKAGASEHIHIPPPSYWPIVLALGMLVFFYGWFVHPWMNVLGVVILLAAVFAWVYEPGYDLTE
jgi:cytochrome c oxidase subunit 1